MGLQVLGREPGQAGGQASQAKLGALRTGALPGVYAPLPPAVREGWAPSTEMDRQLHGPRGGKGGGLGLPPASGRAILPSAVTLGLHSP